MVEFPPEPDLNIVILHPDTHRRRSLKDHAILKSLPTVGEASSREDLKHQVSSQVGLLVILPLARGETDGFGNIKDMESREEQVKFLVVGEGRDGHFILQALRSGSWGYLCSDALEAHLLPALNTLHSGYPYLDPESSLCLIHHLRSLPPECVDVPQELRPLSSRELEIFRRLVKGEATKSIAYHLGISSKTVDHHRGAIYRKLGVGGVGELMRLAWELGLVPGSQEG